MSSLLFPQPFIAISDGCSAVRPWMTMLIQTDKDHLIDRQNALPGDLVADFTTQGERRAPKLSGFAAELDDTALPGRADKIDFGHEFGDTAIQKTERRPIF